MVKLTALIPLAAALTSAHAYTFSAWSNTGYNGREYSTSFNGVHYLGFQAKSYIWNSAFGDGCCVKFCYNRRETGYWCPDHHNENVAPRNQFNKVVTGCGSDVLNC